MPTCDGEGAIIFIFFSKTAGPAVGPGVDEPVETKAVYAEGATENHAKVGETHFINVGGVAYGRKVREKVVEEVVVLKKVSQKIEEKGQKRKNSYIWWKI